MPQLDFDGANSRLSADNIRGQSGSTITIVSGHNLVGSGSGLTALNASNLASGTVATARLGSGTANNGVFLRGDGTWAAAGGGVDGITSSADATAITITSAEKVGIGITNPNSTLVVSDGGAYGMEFYPNDSNVSKILAYDRSGSAYRDFKISANQIILGYGSGGNNEALRIDASGQVGIGTTSPADKLHLASGYFKFTGGAYGIRHDGNLVIQTGANVERVRITSGGNTCIKLPLLVGLGHRTAQVGTGAMEVESTVGQDNGLVVWTTTNNSSDMNMMSFRTNTSSERGSIRSTSSSTSFNTSSDYRLKENVVPMTGAIDRIKLFKPSRFNFIVDSDKVVDGFVAHEAQEVVPESVTGTKDAMMMEKYEVSPQEVDEVGNVLKEPVIGEREVPDMQQIDQAKIVPLTVGALQEAITRIESLEQEVATLKGE